MEYGFLFGSNLLVNTQTTFSVEIDGKIREFFRVREIYKARDENSSYLTIDVDIKDNEGTREVKLFKSNVVATQSDIEYSITKNQTIVSRADGTLIIKIEQLEIDDVTPQLGQNMIDFLNEHKVEALIRVTGNFYAGTILVDANEERVILTGQFGVTISGNISSGTNGITMTQMGFGM
jgi:hypothetical protein